MSKDTNPALAEHTVPDAPAAPVSQAVQTIPPAQAAVEIPQFASPTQEARYHILQYLTKNRGIPQRCWKEYQVKHYTVVIQPRN